MNGVIFWNFTKFEPIILEKLGRLVYEWVTFSWKNGICTGLLSNSAASHPCQNQTWVHSPSPKLILLKFWPKIGPISIWMGHFFLKKWYGGGGTRYKRPYKDVLPTWVAKWAPWYMNNPLWMQNLAYEWGDFLKFHQIWANYFGKIGPIGTWMGHFFLKKWYLYGSTFQFRGITSLPKPNLSTLPLPKIDFAQILAQNWAD